MGMHEVEDIRSFRRTVVYGHPAFQEDNCYLSINAALDTLTRKRSSMIRDVCKDVNGSSKVTSRSLLQTV